MFNYYAREARQKGFRRRPSSQHAQQTPLWDDQWEGEPTFKKTKKVVAPKTPTTRKANKKTGVGAIVDGVRIIDID